MSLSVLQCFSAVLTLLEAREAGCFREAVVCVE